MFIVVESVFLPNHNYRYVFQKVLMKIISRNVLNFWWEWFQARLDAKDANIDNIIGMHMWLCWERYQPLLLPKTRADNPYIVGADEQTHLLRGLYWLSAF